MRERRNEVKIIDQLTTIMKCNIHGGGEGGGVAALVLQNGNVTSITMEAEVVVAVFLLGGRLEC